MIRNTFQHRSGRVIALGRLVLAAGFLVATWIDPSQPIFAPRVAYALLGLYVTWASILLVLTWRDWWLDYRLGPPAHAVDVAAFGIVVFFTEGYTSPFYTFFVFLMLSAAIRSSWRETAVTAAAVLILFVAAGTAALALGGGELDLQPMLIRSSHLVVLSLLIIWFGVNQQSGSPAARTGNVHPDAQAESPPIEAALGHVADRLKARRIVFAWWQEEEPWLNLAELDGGAYRTERVGPEEYGPIFEDRAEDLPFIFRKGGRALRRGDEGPHRLLAFAQRIDPAFAERFGLDEGLVIRVRARDLEGEMTALGISGLCSDDLRDAETLGQEVSALFDRASLVAGSEEAAVARARASLARDLHDSAVQALAGASFRLEALKSWIRSGENAEPEIDAVKAELAAEQRNVRVFIASLRSGRGSTRLTDLASGLPHVADELRRRWNLACEVADAVVRGPLWMEHELHQIIREAAANAVRHGRATSIAIAMERRNGTLELSIADNGSGIPEAAGDGDMAEREAPVSPWSVEERVKGLGGHLSLTSGGEGSRLRIVLPLEDAA